MNAGVYAIKNNITNRVYVGQSRTIFSRWDTHKTMLRTGKHPEKEMQADCNRYGISSFDFIVLESVNNTATLEIKERKWMERYRPVLYNAQPSNKKIGDGVRASWVRRRIVANEILERLKEVSKSK